jgi:hypothetical protein
MESKVIRANALKQRFFNADRKTAVTESVFFALFSASLLFGVVKLFDPSYEASQATLVVIQSVVALVVLIAPGVLEYAFRMRISFSVRLIVCLFVFMAVVLGEAFQLYYRFAPWDEILHFLSGGMIAYIVCCFVRGLMENSRVRRKFLTSIAVAVAVSLAFSLLWELIEFTLDSAFGTNMQKFIPQDSALFNGGAGNAPLNGTDAEIAAFFRSPEGYKYALRDTMSDIAVCFAGTALFTAAAAVKNRADRKAFTRSVVFPYRGAPENPPPVAGKG